MPKEPAERYMEWLEREEERLGIGATARATEDVEAAKRLLYEELGFDPSEAQVSAFMDIGKARYEIMPEVNITSARLERPWGFQTSYRDVRTGRFTSFTEVSERIRNYWAGWGY